MVGSFAGCCARVATGHAAAPPSSVMNSRRFMCVPLAEITPYHMGAVLCITANLGADWLLWVKCVTSCALDACGMSATPPVPAELMRHNKTSRGATTAQNRVLIFECKYKRFLLGLRAQWMFGVLS